MDVEDESCGDALGRLQRKAYISSQPVIKTAIRRALHQQATRSEGRWHATAMLIGIVDSVGGNVGGVNAIAIANIISMAIAIVSLTKTKVKAPAIYRVWPEQRRLPT